MNHSPNSENALGQISKGQPVFINKASLEHSIAHSHCVLSGRQLRRFANLDERAGCS